MLLVAVVVVLALLATSDRAEAAAPSGRAVCFDNMVDMQPPVAGQKSTLLKFYFWDGMQWNKNFEERFNGPIVGGSVVYNDADRVFMAPKDRYIAVKAWGYYPDQGWVSYPMGHGYQLSKTFTGKYCRA